MFRLVIPYIMVICSQHSREILRNKNASNAANTSVYRALMDTDSDDATAWAVQTADAKQKTKTGKIVGGVGLGVGVVGNITESILNDKNNEKNMRIK